MSLVAQIQAAAETLRPVRPTRPCGRYDPTAHADATTHPGSMYQQQVGSPLVLNGAMDGLL
eukprot:360614-Chlamydomonas_euryale.AAC.5